MKTTSKPVLMYCGEPQCCRLHKKAWLLYQAAGDVEAFMDELTGIFEHAEIPALGRLRRVIDRIDGGNDDDQ